MPNAKCPKSNDFVRRTALYASYDAQLFEYTRFYAAASTINDVLAKLFAVVPPSRLSRCFRFLANVGSALEITNRAYARALARGVPGHGLDRALVCAEQEQLQRYVESQRAEHPAQWIATRNELNGFLNGCAASIFCRSCAGSWSFCRVLRDVREHVGGTEIDFAIELHRVSIGMKLIEYIRAANAMGRYQRGVGHHIAECGFAK